MPCGLYNIHFFHLRVSTIIQSHMIYGNYFNITYMKTIMTNIKNIDSNSDADWSNHHQSWKRLVLHRERLLEGLKGCVTLFGPKKNVSGILIWLSLPIQTSQLKVSSSGVIRYTLYYSIRWLQLYIMICTHYIIYTSICKCCYFYFHTDLCFFLFLLRTILSPFDSLAKKSICGAAASASIRPWFRRHETMYNLVANTGGHVCT